MPDLSTFASFRLLVGIYKILSRAFISIAFMAAGYLRRLANALSEITLYDRLGKLTSSAIATRKVFSANLFSLPTPVFRPENCSF